MSEVSTSPATSAAPAAESSAPAISGVGDSAAANGTESVVESPASSGELEASTNTLAESIPAETPEVSSNETTPTQEFNLESWDGNIEVLPENLRGPIEFLHRQLEGGYTKKFQDLSEQRKSYETAKEQFERDRTGWSAKKEAFDGEAALFRSILGDEQDPRLSQMTSEIEEYKSKVESLQGEYDEYRQIVDADLQEQADIYAKNFRETNSDIFDSEDKRTQLSRLLNDGWDPEKGVKLVGQTEEVLNLANSLLEKGTPASVAVEHAFLSLNAQVRTPRPAARLTSGAESRNNPESVSQESFATNDPREARFAAARAAMAWKQKQG